MSRYLLTVVFRRQLERQIFSIDRYEFCLLLSADHTKNKSRQYNIVSAWGASDLADAYEGYITTSWGIPHHQLNTCIGYLRPLSAEKGFEESNKDRGHACRGLVTASNFL